MGVEEQAVTTRVDAVMGLQAILTLTAAQKPLFI